MYSASRSIGHFTDTLSVSLSPIRTRCQSRGGLWPTASNRSLGECLYTNLSEILPILAFLLNVFECETNSLGSRKYSRRITKLTTTTKPSSVSCSLSPADSSTPFGEGHWRHGPMSGVVIGLFFAVPDVLSTLRPCQPQTMAASPWSRLPRKYDLHVCAFVPRCHLTPLQLCLPRSKTERRNHIKNCSQDGKMTIQRGQRVGTNLSISRSRPATSLAGRHTTRDIDDACGQFQDLLRLLTASVAAVALRWRGDAGQQVVLIRSGYIQSLWRRRHLSP